MVDRGSRGRGTSPSVQFLHYHSVFDKNYAKQEFIPVGCIQPACRPYPSMHCWGGVYLPSGGVPAWGGVPTQRVYLPRECTCPGGVYLPGGVPVQRGCTCPGTPPPVNRMTDRCKNSTLPQTSFAGGNNCLTPSLPGLARSWESCFRYWFTLFARCEIKCP